MHPAPFRVGLTGGIAAGKSTVAELWRTHGAQLIDTDAIAHEALAPDTTTYHKIVRTFGSDILNPDGTVNRPALGAIVFGDPVRRSILNGIVHPVVRQRWRAWLADQAGLAVVVIPLLYEVGAEGDFDAVVVVACRPATQLARLLAKGLDAAQAEARIRSQWPVHAKMDRADFVIWNDGPLPALAAQAKIVWHQLQERTHASRQISTEITRLQDERPTLSSTHQDRRPTG